LVKSLISKSRSPSDAKHRIEGAVVGD
jgi:hypothetical protein